MTDIDAPVQAPTPETNDTGRDSSPSEPPHAIFDDKVYGKKLAKVLHADNSFDGQAVKAFQLADSAMRIRILAKVRASGYTHMQKHLPVVTALLIFILGFVGVSLKENFSSLSVSLAQLEELVASNTPLVEITDLLARTTGNQNLVSIITGAVLIFLVLAVGREGRSDAKKEANHIAWLKALETADAIATKCEDEEGEGKSKASGTTGTVPGAAG